jgi:hypothetical protein
MPSGPVGCKPNTGTRWTNHVVLMRVGAPCVTWVTPDPRDARMAPRGVRYTTTVSSISVTSAAIGERSDRVRVTWEKSG